MVILWQDCCGNGNLREFYCSSIFPKVENLTVFSIICIIRICNNTFLSEPCSSQCGSVGVLSLKDFVSNAIKKFMVAEPVGSTDVYTEVRDLRAAQDRRVERGSLRRQEEPYQASSVKLLERSECGRPATLKK